MVGREGEACKGKCGCGGVRAIYIYGYYYMYVLIAATAVLAIGIITFCSEANAIQCI